MPGYQTRYSGGGLTALQSGGGRTFISGWYYTGHWATADATATLTQSVEYASRFEVGAATTFDRIGIEVTTNQANGVVRLGIRYDSGAGVPGELLLDAGTIDASTNGFKEITISQVLTPGRWWISATGQAAAGIVVRSRGVDPYLGATVNTTFNCSSLFGSSRTGALPASFGSLSASLAGPKILLRAA